MKLPWHDKNGYSKAIAILATILTVSIGLCGANFFATVRFVPMAGPGPPPGTPTWPGTLLGITGWAEIIAIGGSLLGLCIVADLRARRKRKNTESEANDKGV